MKKRHSFEFLVLLLVFSLYACGALFLCVRGAEAFRQTSQVMQENYDLRTGVFYLAEKIHQNDAAGAIRIDSANGSDALVLIERVGGQAFETWIFIDGESLSELTISAGESVSVAKPQAIMPMKGMSLKLGPDGLIDVSLTTMDGRQTSTSLLLRSGGQPQGGVGL
jgi:hypothetical protein